MLQAGTSGQPAHTPTSIQSPPTSPAEHTVLSQWPDGLDLPLGSLYPTAWQAFLMFFEKSDGA